MKKTCILFLLSLFFIGLNFSIGGGHGHHKGQGHYFDYEKLGEKLGLDEKQKKAVAELKKSKDEKFKSKNEKIKRLKDKLHKAFSVYPVDKGTVEKFTAELATTKAEFVKLKINSKLIFVSILTKEQHKKLMDWHSGQGKGCGCDHCKGLTGKTCEKCKAGKKCEDCAQKHKCQKGKDGKKCEKYLNKEHKCKDSKKCEKCKNKKKGTI